MSDGARKSGPPTAEQAAAASAFGQDLLTQLQHDFGAESRAAKKALVAATTQALVSKLQEDSIALEQHKRKAAAELANALLDKVARDFGSVPPAAPASAPPADAPPPPPAVSDEELERAASAGPLSAEELADLDAMTAPDGFWGRIARRLQRRRG